MKLVNILKMTLFGIAWGCTICIFILMIGAATIGDEFLAMSAEQFIRQSLGSMLVGIAFTVPSLIYQVERLNMVIKTLIHMVIGFAVYLPVAFSMGWIPTNYGLGMVALSFCIAFAFAFIIWLFFYLHSCKEARKLNEKLENLN